MLIRKYILLLPRTWKQGIAVSFDLVAIFSTLAFAYWLRLDDLYVWPGPNLFVYLLAAVFSIPIFAAHGLYSSVIRYIDISVLRSITRACLIYGVIFCLVVLLGKFSGVPRTVGITQPALLLLVTLGSRLFVSIVFGRLDSKRVNHQKKQRVLIWGAGEAGRQIVTSIRQHDTYDIVGFIDEDASLWNRSILSQKVFPPSSLQSLMRSQNIAEVLLAIPDTRDGSRRRAIETLSTNQVRVRTIPSLSDIISGDISLSDIRDLELEDLLDRDPVKLDQSPVTDLVSGKNILVTGAGGSIGSEISRQLLKLNPKSIVLLDHSEPQLYTIHLELQSLVTEKSRLSTTVSAVLGSVRDHVRLASVFRQFEPDVVIHSAAYKHVTIVEDNPSEGLLTNVFGTMACAIAAADNNVENFVLVSTDKSVRPTSVMGASKRVSEMILQAMAADIRNASERSIAQAKLRTKFCMVRFGNVLGSSGSVIPLFRQQIRTGGPVTITHPEATRYLMTIPEAAQLVLNAAALSKGGEVFLLDMGVPVRIYDLALRLISLAGMTVRSSNNPTGDIEVKIVGLRPGEKLHEELLIGNNAELTSNNRIFVAKEEFLAWGALTDALSKLRKAIDEGNQEQMREQVFRMAE